MALIKPEQLRSGLYEISGSFSGSFQGDGSGLTDITASTAPNYVLTSSYIQDSASFNTHIFTNSSSIDTLSGSFIGFSGSYITDSASFDTRISNNSSSIDLLSGSFDSFTQTYNTGSFTGSFIGDGSQLTGIVSSKWSGSNPISRDSDVEITGSLFVNGEIFSNIEKWTFDFMDGLNITIYADDNYSIDEVINVVGTPTITIELNDLPYTLGDPINLGDKIYIESNVNSVVKLKIIK